MYAYVGVHTYELDLHFIFIQYHGNRDVNGGEGYISDISKMLISSRIYVRFVD